MSAAFPIDFHVGASGGVNSLHAGLYLPRRSGTKLDLPKRKAS
ncbi:MAG TPA: hypothetical protein VKE70_20165 [Candidatus Solibacter sp.]|nr:hypothetical protein [Candidatus Solibacter sp.]